MTEERTQELMTSIRENYPEQLIREAFIEYRARRNEVDIISDKYDFEVIVEKIYQIFNQEPNAAIRDQRWKVQDRHIWQTDIADLRYKEGYQVPTEDEGVIENSSLKLIDEKLAWFPTAIALARHIDKTWTGQPGSFSSIEGELINF